MTELNSKSFYILGIFLLILPIFSLTASVEEMESSSVIKARSAGDRPDGTQYTAEDDKYLETFLDMMDKFDANRTDTHKIRAFLFEGDGVNNGTMQLKGRLLGDQYSESMAGVDFDSYMKTMTDIAMLMQSLKEYSSVVCPYMAATDFETMRKIFNVLLDQIYKPKMN
ncbi:uncharacterized protein LOC120354165 [Nilaparvata lugens]|uniref:uncharacterized protein LOC120354165 n=1 Tax=Nilaparvata lugens TaxID=108931 RepID=UPI00193CAF45|nr:uncharacterized protein LOC120354165 [Nilaparvata lugens]